jgi:Asp-tRNA(Asn)/Glu-tRNA(Gln) amidotransferase A subunit family amidase
MSLNEQSSSVSMSTDPGIQVPENIDELAFYPVTSLAQLIRSQKITSVELTKMYLARLKKYGPRLECIITLTEKLAMKQAKMADEEIATGHYRGPLHGIPWGAKDLLATKGIRTTWGAMPYKDQIIDEDATVVERLKEAGAVLVAKLTMGALAMGDVWYGGKTKNPWNLEQGSSGSSAGSAAATSAGLVGFAIGTETLGSIVSPSTRCGVTGLRPSYGRVSRYGAMALSWSMDKIGPICRTVEDCALVFHAIQGPDGKDLTIVDVPFGWNPSSDLLDIRVGFLTAAFEQKSRTKENDQAALEVLRSLGIELIPFELPEFPARAISHILSAEAAAAFDDLTRSGKDNLLVRQGRGAWPNSFRQARFIPAVEYIQANRLRTLLMQKMAERMGGIDVFITPTYGGNNLLITNLTGHPAVVVPSGFDDKGNPTSITFIGNLFEEGKALRVAKAYQDATGFHLKHPSLEE